MTVAETSSRQVLSDVELLTKKNNQIKKLRIQAAVQWIVIIALALTIAGVALISRFGSPSAQPDIDVVTREVFDNDGSNIRVPATYEPGQELPIITAGQAFTYNTRGVKNEAVGGDIDYQLVCQIDGSEQLTNIGNAYSNAAKGKLNITRSFTISVTTRLQDSDKCRMQIIAAYIFYQRDAGGTTQPIEVKEIGTSNYFKLRVPKDAKGSQTDGFSNETVQP